MASSRFCANNWLRLYAPRDSLFVHWQSAMGGGGGHETVFTLHELDMRLVTGFMFGLILFSLLLEQGLEHLEHSVRHEVCTPFLTLPHKSLANTHLGAQHEQNLALQLTTVCVCSPHTRQCLLSCTKSS